MPYTYGTPEWEEAFVKKVQERIASQPRPFIVFSPEWIGEWEKYVQNDVKYKELALPNWESSVVLHLLKNPALGVDQDIYVKLDLWHNGECRSIRYVPSEVGKKADMVVTASIERWLQVARKQVDVIKGMMQGKLKLKGNLPLMVKSVKSSVHLVDTVGELGGKLPDELTPEETENFRNLINELVKEFDIA